MKLVCFPNYTCGAIFCDILNLQSSRVGKSNNFYSGVHNLGKIKPVNNMDGTGYDPEDLYYATLRPENTRQVKDLWIGTHCWPGLIDTKKYKKIINVTTTTSLSRIYRFARIFYTMVAGRYPGVPTPKRPTDIFNYNIGFENVYADNVINIEFEHWVNLSCEVEDILLKLSNAPDNKHLHQRRKVWMELNNFLYDETRMNYIFKIWDEVHK